MKILVDTNVILDTLTSRVPWNKHAEQIFILAANRQVDMYLTASSATDIYYLLRKHLHSTDTAKQMLGRLYTLAGILDVCSEDCIDALASPINDYEDAVAERVACRNNMDYIVTRNLKDYQAGNARVISPDDFVRKMAESQS